ncbi:BQ2448_2041 [Microbotryum intermedium]|uniref:BQ2448_2041 protein n=1 Tax=Microbotryum intermedium TaxID=269621 RepID=A0A238FA55_9BASI|nr:BQ2448_2041 [Microbotryum intermedium]
MQPHNPWTDPGPTSLSTVDPSTGTSTTSFSDPTLTPHQAALLAAEARAKAQALAATPLAQPTDAHRQQHQPFDPLTFQAGAKDKLPFHRLLDAQLLPRCTKTQAVQTLQLMQIILGNLLEPPNPAQAMKYRQLRMSNAQIQRHLVNVSSSSAIDFLLLCSFRIQTIEFTEYLIFPPSPSAKQLHQLKLGAHVVAVVLAKAKEAEEREGRYRQSEKDVQEERKRKALLQFDEDRRLKMEKDERERIVRIEKARQASEAEAKAELERQRLQADDASELPVFTGSTSAARSMTIDRNDDDDDEDAGDRPPSYGSVTGRVLGTGEPVVDHDGFVQNQDLETSDEDEYEDA